MLGVSVVLGTLQGAVAFWGWLPGAEVIPVVGQGRNLDLALLVHFTQSCADICRLIVGMVL